MDAETRLLFQAHFFDRDQSGSGMTSHMLTVVVTRSLRNLFGFISMLLDHDYVVSVAFTPAKSVKPNNCGTNVVRVSNYAIV